MERHDRMGNYPDDHEVSFSAFCTPAQARSDPEGQKFGQYTNLTRANPDNLNPDCSENSSDVIPDDIPDVRQDDVSPDAKECFF